MRRTPPRRRAVAAPSSKVSCVGWVDANLWYSVKLTWLKSFDSFGIIIDEILLLAALNYILGSVGS